MSGTEAVKNSGLAEPTCRLGGRHCWAPDASRSKDGGAAPIGPFWEAVLLERRVSALRTNEFTNPQESNSQEDSVISFPSLDFRVDELDDVEISDLGMTPTPSKAFDTSDADNFPDEPFIPTPTLDGLLDDALDASTVKSRRSDSIPHFASPQEAAAYLAAGRTDLDMEIQRRLRSFTSNDERTEWISRQQRAATLSEDQRRFALNALVAEAARRAIGSSAHRFGADAKRRCFKAWRSLMSQVSRDHELDGAQAPQRNLSCMCIFSPHRLSAFPPMYGDSSLESSSRVASQVSVLRSLGLQRALGSSSLFLHPADSTPNAEKNMTFTISME